MGKHVRMRSSEWGMLPAGEDAGAMQDAKQRRPISGSEYVSIPLDHPAYRNTLGTTTL